ncbi:MAG TPA: hypothetical protein DCW95_06035 [Chryseobacterium sp.]|nr:hypothetical protein [Chryseobacterium sp.]
MKKLISTALLVGGFAFSAVTLTSCDRIEEAVEDVAIPVPFDIPLSIEQKIPFASVKTDSYLAYPAIDLDIDLNAKIKEEYPKLSINNLKSAKLSSFNIELKESLLGGDLSAVQNARVYIKTPDLEKILVATVENNTSGDKIVFTPTDAELLPYFQSTKNSLILEIQGRKLTLDEFTININPSFKISVGF